MESVSLATFWAITLYWGYAVILLVLADKSEESKATDGKCRAIGWSGIALMFLWLGSYAYAGEISSVAATIVSGGAASLYLLMVIGKAKVAGENPYTTWQYVGRTSAIMMVTFVVTAISLWV